MRVSGILTLQRHLFNYKDHNMAINYKFTPIGTEILDEYILCDEEITIDSVLYHKGYICNTVNQNILTDTDYGIWTLAGKAGTKLDISLTGVPTTDVILDCKNGYLLSATNTGYYIRYLAHTPINIPDDLKIEIPYVLPENEEVEVCNILNKNFRRFTSASVQIIGDLPSETTNLVLSNGAAPQSPQSQTQGPHLVSEVFVSDHWYDRDNILYDDDADAATYTTGVWPREHLYVYNAGFTNLNGATFTGIEVTFRAKSDRAGDADALFVNCVHGSQKLGNTKEKTLGTSFATDTMGGPSDLWGMTQEEAQLYIPINASFGLELDSSLYASGDKVWVDWIKIKVYYTQNSAARAWSAGSRTVEGDYAIAQNGDLSTSVALRLSQTTRLPQFPAMTTQGFLKNDASGNVTGGNNAALADGSVLTTQHYHSALAASDGSPNPAVTVDTGGNIGIGCTPSSKLSIGSTDGTQQVGAYHDNSNAYFNTSKGSIIYTTTEGTNTPLSVYWKGKGTGHSEFRLYDVGAQTNCLIIGCYGGYGSLYGTGAGLQPLRIMETADTGVSFFTSAASGETPAVTISGYRAADAKRTLSVAVGSEANDTASFTGLTNYKFTGSINATANLQTGGTTRIDSAGAATLGNITSSAYNVPRGRGIGTTLPSTDLRDWDMFFRSDINTLYIYVSGSWRAAAPLP